MNIHVVLRISIHLVGKHYKFDCKKSGVLLSNWNNIINLTIAYIVR